MAEGRQRKFAFPGKKQKSGEVRQPLGRCPKQERAQERGKAKEICVPVERAKDQGGVGRSRKDARITRNLKKEGRQSKFAYPWKKQKSGEVRQESERCPNQERAQEREKAREICLPGEKPKERGGQARAGKMPKPRESSGRREGKGNLPAWGKTKRAGRSGKSWEGGRITRELREEGRQGKFACPGEEQKSGEVRQELERCPNQEKAQERGKAEQICLPGEKAKAHGGQARVGKVPESR
ncbi:hypothetical protein [Alteribacillus iranensis]|uniref:hypothetical protein n=1 Tax=Alteribacillus iranensis TaxID=930128 RepID=UPI000B8A2842|nr:hypothetical protein [Alteribacillus iranensis]